MNGLIELVAEDAMPAVWTLGFAAVLAVVATAVTRRVKYLFAAGGLVALAVVWLGVEWLWQTDRERVDGVIDELAAAVRAEDVAGIATHLAPRCQFERLDRDGILQRADAVFRQFDIDRLTISNRKTRVLRQSQQATTEFLAVARGRQNKVDLSPYPTRWMLTLSRDAQGVWQVIQIQQRQAFGDGELPSLPRGDELP